MRLVGCTLGILLRVGGEVDDFHAGGHRGFAVIANGHAGSARNAHGQIVPGAFRVGLSRDPWDAITLSLTTNVALGLYAVDAQVGPFVGAAER